jgi:dihydroxyacetone kinase
MPQFMNAKEDMVVEAIDGVIASSGGRLIRLDGYPHIRVVLRTNWDKTKVALISGGGSGHEPAHVGFVGEGMLACAICGDIFASPSVEAVLAGILAVTGEAGCVLIVKNYTGDRLNFGLAAERARALGLKVNMVIVQDDIAIPDLSRPRGLAGTLFVHKIAGALAESGGDLNAVTDAAKLTARGAMSIGMSLDTCTVPGSQKEKRTNDGEIELGLGIHGEPGAQHIAYSNAKQAIADVAAKFEPHLADNSYVAMINNLGGCTELEMSILANDLRCSLIGSKITHVVGPAMLMTALDMHGFSISILPVSAENLRLLEAPTEIQAWPGINRFISPTHLPLPLGLKAIRPTPSVDINTANFLIGCCGVLIACEHDLNLLDAKSGDGDTGSTLAKAASALIDRIDQLPLADHTQLCCALGQELSQTMGGSSGVLMAIFFAATGDARSSGCSLPQALKIGLARMQDVGGAKLGDRTMVDALAPALDCLEVSLKDAALAARQGANLTALIGKANAGRATYVSSEHLFGHIDPGAEAVARVFEHIASV